MDKINLQVPAKINLYLRIIRKRPDGYHDIDTLMQAVSFYDDLTLEKADDITLCCDGLDDIKQEDNLAYKAACLVAEMAQYPGVKITLKKNIPHGAGLGGGSADAAFVIRGLISLYALKLKKDELLRRASCLGADIPFFLSRGQARTTGIGDIIEQRQLPLNYEILIIKPEISINTTRAYGAVKIPIPSAGTDNLPDRLFSLPELVSVLEKEGNDFENVVFTRYPNLAIIKRDLQSEGALIAGMSGSGSAIFGLFESADAPAKIAAKFRDNKIQAYICRPIVLVPL